MNARRFREASFPSAILPASFCRKLADEAAQLAVWIRWDHVEPVDAKTEFISVDVVQLLLEKCFNLLIGISGVHRIAHKLHAHIVIAFLDEPELRDAGNAVCDFPKLEHGSLLAVFMADHVI